MVSDREDERLRMVETQLRARGLEDERVLTAMARVPRHLFVPDDMVALAYADEPLPISRGQTISQPYIVAYMTEALRLRGGEKVLEVGTGSGYQTAVLAEAAGEIWTVELVEELSFRAKERLDALGYENIRFRVGDGSAGWPDAAPFDGIIVTAAPASVPGALELQLAPGGRMIVPVGLGSQELVLILREGDFFRRKELIGVRFVPLVRRGACGAGEEGED
jgi:protein-L-isoaspartate(D-aspartate) O-methyltransferase